MTTNHTPTPWRIGDAGHTVFGPPNGNPSPKIVAYDLMRDDAHLIVRAVNSHHTLVEALQALLKAGAMFNAWGDYGSHPAAEQARAALALAKT